MLALLPAVVLAVSPRPCFEARQLAEGRCAEALVELEFRNATQHNPGLERYPGVDPYAYAQELIAAPIPGLRFDERYWRVCFQQLWEANRRAREIAECRQPLARALHETIPPARVALEAKARAALRRFRSRDGFGALRWGMSARDIRARVPNTTTHNAWLASVGSHHGRAADFAYQLLSDRLIRVDIFLHAASPQDAFDLFTTIVRDVDKHHGVPYVVGDHVAWIVGQTRLEVAVVNEVDTQGVRVVRHSIELEMWALKMRGGDGAQVDNTSVGQEL